MRGQLVPESHSKYLLNGYIANLNNECVYYTNFVDCVDKSNLKKTLGTGSFML